MGQDISSDVADLIGGAKTVGASENIRHGRYRFMITNISAEVVENDKGNHRMAFWEVVPIKSEPNPQVEGDRVDYVSPAQVGTGPLKDDGTKPNPVGSRCAMKVNFDGPGGRSAGANIKEAILALFNIRAADTSDEEIKKTWKDLSLQKDIHKGEAVGFDQETKQVVLAAADKRAQPARGMVIDCVTMAKRKRTPNDKGAYITKCIWSCAAPMGQGENSPELVAKRRAEIEAQQITDDDDEEAPTQSQAPAQSPAPVSGSAPQAAARPAPPAPARPEPPARPAPPAVPFAPPSGWQAMINNQGPTPQERWFWNPTTNAVKSEQEFLEGK